MFSCCKCKDCGKIMKGGGSDQIIAEKQSLLTKQKRKTISKQSGNFIELLILGPSESGKSTVCRQLLYMSNSGIPEGEIQEIKKNINRNILIGVRDILSAMKMYKTGFALEQNFDAAARMSIIDPESTMLNPEIVADIKSLFNDQNVKNVLKRKNEFGLQETVFYYINKIDEILNPNYIPTWDDAVRVRKRTAESSTYEFIFKGCSFRLRDVGGERGERGEWIDYFEKAFLAIYIASLADFDMPLREDLSVNRLTEAIRLFGSIARNDILSKKDIILFLNKKDIFKEKLETKSISVLFPDYEGSQDYLESVHFIRDKFLQASGRRNLTSIRTFVTMATDTSCMNKVFNAVHDRVVQIISSIYLM